MPLKIACSANINAACKSAMLPCYGDVHAWWKFIRPAGAFASSLASFRSGLIVVCRRAAGAAQ
jgi:hypothetical protein